MEEFQCTYLNHENENILGFCFHKMCQNTSQFCLKCLIKFHQGHQYDCLSFNSMIQFIKTGIQVYTIHLEESKQIFEKIKTIFDLHFKLIDSNILRLKELLHNIEQRSYQLVKASVNFIKDQCKQQKQSTQSEMLNLMNKVNEAFQISKSKTLFPKNKQITNHQSTDNHSKYQAMNDDERILKMKEVYAVAKQLFLQEKYQDALEHLDEYLQSGFNYYKAFNLKGMILKSQKRSNEAIECFDKAILTNPNYSKAYNNKGCTLDEMSLYNEALNCFNKAVQINPNFNEAYNNKGLTLLNLKQYSEAIIAFDQALKIQQQPLYLRNKADSLFEMGREQEAEQLYLNALNVQLQY